jgi:hypothetical protein
MEDSRKRRGGLLAASRVLVGAPAVKRTAIYDFDAAYLIEDGRVVSIRGDKIIINQGGVSRTYDGKLPAP